MSQLYHETDYMKADPKQLAADSKQHAKEAVERHKQKHLPTAVPTVLRDLEMANQEESEQTS